MNYLFLDMYILEFDYLARFWMVDIVLDYLPSISKFQAQVKHRYLMSAVHQEMTTWRR